MTLGPACQHPLVDDLIMLTPVDALWMGMVQHGRNCLV